MSNRTAWRRSLLGVTHAALALLLALGAPTWSRPIHGPQLLLNMNHHAWRVESGAPADIWTIAGGRDGFLWLGTGSGLYRFDGLQFERYQPPSDRPFPSNNINALLVLPGGDIWLGFYRGGISRVSSGDVTHYGERDGLGSGRVVRLASDRDGTIWAATHAGLARFNGKRWQVVGEDWGYPATRADHVFVDRDGTLWVSADSTILSLPYGARRFRPSGLAVRNAQALAQASDGRLWVADELNGTRPLSPTRNGRLAPAIVTPPAGASVTHLGAAEALAFDERGDLWLTDASVGGLTRVREPNAIRDGHAWAPAAQAERFSETDGLPSNVASPLYSDAEGNVWVGTNFGLSRFRASAFNPVRELDHNAQLGYAMTAMADGSVWVSNGLSTYRLRDGDATHIALPADVRSMHATDNGVLWIESQDKLTRVRGSQRVAFPLPAGPQRRVRAFALAPDGTPWLSQEGAGVYRLRDRGFEQVLLPASEQAAPGAMHISGDNEALLGLANGEMLALAPSGHTERFGAAQGLNVGPITAIHVGDRFTLVAGEEGLALRQGRRFRSLRAGEHDELAQITGIVETAEGSVWLNGWRGVVHFTPEALEIAFGLRRGIQPPRVFDFRDGLRGIALQVRSAPTAMQDRTGRLWFATNRGISWIDPARLRANAVAPRVAIRSVVVGDEVHEGRSPLQLDAGTRQVLLQYTALSLSDPDRIRFRFRLEGVDDAWRDAETRRDIAYANLGAGSYRFQVIAGNADGVWSATPAEMTFVIPPTFVQSRWFLLLCAVFVISLGWFAYTRRIRAVGRRMRELLEERHLERERIARELHDTLLQGVQGLILRFQAATEMLPAEDPARHALERVLERGDDVLEEGRDRVKGLRRAPLASLDLPDALRAVGADLVAGSQIDFNLQVIGARRPLTPLARDELQCIASEAMTNAVRHSKGTRIEVVVTYREDDLRVAVIDNGVGFEAEVLASGGRNDHWGVSGMRERAARVGGHVALSSPPSGGARVQLTVPAITAYGTHAGGPVRRLVARLFHTGGAA